MLYQHTFESKLLSLTYYTRTVSCSLTPAQQSRYRAPRGAHTHHLAYIHDESAS